MMTNEEVKQKVDQILDSLAQKEEQLKSWRLGVGAIVYGVVLFLLVARGRGTEDENNYFGQLLLPLLPAAITALAVFWLFLLPEVKRLRNSYIDTFSLQEDRLIADRMLAAASVERSLESFQTFRGKLGVVLSRFKCHACGAHVEIERMGERVNCPRCRVELVVPEAFPCPSCGEKNTRVISREEQVQPIDERRATAVGGLAYGITGIISGVILDAILRPFKLGFRSLLVAIKKNVFYCNKCSCKWATTLQSPSEAWTPQPVCTESKSGINDEQKTATQIPAAGSSPETLQFATDIIDGDIAEIVDLDSEDSYYHERSRFIGSLVMVKSPIHSGDGWYSCHASFKSRDGNEYRNTNKDDVLFGCVRLKRISER